MRYIEIQEGITLNIDYIEGIEKIDDMKCKIYTRSRSYLATFPYSTLLEMMKQDDTIDKQIKNADITKNINEKLDKVLNKAQYWAG